MKFMKLGNRPDTLITEEATRTVISDVPSDLTIQINNISYLLHKVNFVAGKNVDHSKPTKITRIILVSGMPSYSILFFQSVDYCNDSSQILKIPAMPR